GRVIENVALAILADLRLGVGRLRARAHVNAVRNARDARGRENFTEGRCRFAVGLEAPLDPWTGRTVQPPQLLAACLVIDDELRVSRASDGAQHQAGCQSGNKCAPEARFHDTPNCPDPRLAAKSSQSNRP